MCGTSLVFSFKFMSTYQYNQIKSADFFPKMPEIFGQLKIINNKISCFNLQFIEIYCCDYDLNKITFL